MKSRCQPGIVATGPLLPTASLRPLPPSVTPPPSPHIGPGLGWGRTRATEEDETFSGSKECPETDCQERPPGRPHAAKGALGQAAQGRKERAFGVSCDVCLLLGRLGPCLLASEN